MRAVLIKEYTEPKNVSPSEVPRPESGPGTSVIRVEAAGVNPSDVKNIQGLFAHRTTLPRIIGRDYAGVVEEGPAEWVGQEVWGSGGDMGFIMDGTYAEYLAVPSTYLQRKPKNLSMAEAASAGVPYFTAYSGLVNLCKVQRDETVLIIGASGAVGTAVAQIAMWKGAKVIASLRNENDNLTYQAPTVNLSHEDLPQRVHDLTDGKGADVCFNAVGGATLGPSITSLANHGRIVCISAIGSRESSIDVLYFYRNNLTMYGLDTAQATGEEAGKVLELLRPGFESGVIKLNEPEEVPLDRAGEAFAKVLAGSGKKIVLIP